MPDLRGTSRTPGKRPTWWKPCPGDTPEGPCSFSAGHGGRCFGRQAPLPPLGPAHPVVVVAARDVLAARELAWAAGVEICKLRDQIDEHEHVEGFDGYAWDFTWRPR